MAKRRDILATLGGVSSSVVLAGCSEGRSEEEEEMVSEVKNINTPEPTPEQITEEPFYEDEFDGQEIVRTHINELRKKNGGSYKAQRSFRTEYTDAKYNIGVHENLSDGRWDLVANAPDYSKPTDEFWFGDSRLYRLSREFEEDTVSYRNGDCAWLRFARNPFSLRKDEVAKILSNVSYVYEGVEERDHYEEEERQIYASKGTQMVDLPVKKLITNTLLSEDYVADGSAFNLHNWESILEFDKNRIIKHSSLKFEADFLKHSERRIPANVEIVFDTRDVGGQVVEEPDWLDKAQAVIEGNKCELADPIE